MDTTHERMRIPHWSDLNHVEAWIVGMWNTGSLLMFIPWAIAGFFVALKPFFIVASMSLGINFLSGVLAAYVRNTRKRRANKPLTERDLVLSARMWDTLFKASIVFLAVVLAKSIEVFLFVNVPLAHGITGVVVLAETKSFGENFKSITGYDIFAVFEKIIPGIGKK